MSNYGQAALTIVGFAIGAAFGYPQLGFVLGSLAGQALFPTQLPGVSGPRLNDTKTTVSQVGAPIMEVFGVDVVPGVIIYTGPVVEVATQEEQGKGGSSQTVTTYTYYQTIAIGLCKGPQTGISRIWENGKLVYDAREGTQDYRWINDVLLFEGAEQLVARAAASFSYSGGFTLYLGTSDQLPDPTLEAELGIGNVPAFRDLMYVVYPNRELKQDQGLRHPNFKFEIAPGVVEAPPDEPDTISIIAGFDTTFPDYWGYNFEDVGTMFTADSFGSITRNLYYGDGPSQPPLVILSIVQELFAPTTRITHLRLTTEASAAGLSPGNSNSTFVSFTLNGVTRLRSDATYQSIGNSYGGTAGHWQWGVSGSGVMTEGAVYDIVFDPPDDPPV